MDNIDFDVLRACSHWLAEGLRCELVTVLRTWGSSPRPEGSMLGICEDGQIIGSVSGGCIEDDMIARARSDGFCNDKPAIVTYGVTADEAHRFGLPCGGTLELVKEPLSALSLIDELLSQLDAGQLVARRLELDTGIVSLHVAQAEQSMQITQDSVITVHGPRWRLLIIGAGQLSRFVARIAPGLGYAVTVCDPRDEYRHAWDVPDVKLNTGMPDDVVLAMRMDARTAVVALTHDPKLDDLALMEALRSKAFYVGALGSKLNNQRRRERLMTHFDMSSAEMEKLHGPIGLYIGSKTPGEIAISILAELTAVKNAAALSTALKVTHAENDAGMPLAQPCVNT